MLENVFTSDLDIKKLSDQHNSSSKMENMICLLLLSNQRVTFTDSSVNIRMINFNIIV